MNGLDLASKWVLFGLTAFKKNLTPFPRIRRFHLKLWILTSLEKPKGYLPSFLHVAAV